MRYAYPLLMIFIIGMWVLMARVIIHIFGYGYITDLDSLVQVASTLFGILIPFSLVISAVIIPLLYSREKEVLDREHQ